MQTLLRTVVPLLLLGFAAAPALGSEATAPAAVSFQADAIANLEDVGGKLVALAEALPADKFVWRPVEGVRTVSEVFMHVVGTNLLLPPVLGAAPPSGVPADASPFALMQEWERTVTSKEAVIAKLKESVEYATKAIAGIEDLDTMVNLFGPKSKRAYVLILVSHAHEHLGQAIAYARMAGVTPPWSRQADGG